MASRIFFGKLIRLFVRPTMFLLLHLIESEKPIFTLLFGFAGLLFKVVSFLYTENLSFGNLILLIMASAATGSFIDFCLGSRGQRQVRSSLETFWIKWGDWPDWRPAESSDDRTTNSNIGTQKSQIHQISLVTRVSLNAIWSRVTRVVLLMSAVVYLTIFTQTSYLYIGVLASLASLLALDAGIIWWRSAKGEYGLSRLEVKEVGRLIAAARQRRDKGGDPGSFLGVFPDDPAISSEWIWAQPKGLRI